jgi:hypothetical protein
VDNTKKYFARVEDAGDGSGDAILIFPDDFAKEFGLLPGQIVDLNVENGVLTIRKNYEHYKT